MADFRDDPGFQYRLREGQKLLDGAKQVIPPTNPPQASPTEPWPIPASPEKGTNALATNPPTREAPPVRRVSNAPKPPTELSGRGSWRIPPDPKPTRMPAQNGDQVMTAQALPTFANRFFGGNFFPPNDPRHEFWETNARYAVEEQARLGAKMLTRIPANSAKMDEFLVWFLDIVAGRFDIVAKRFLVFMDAGSQSFGLYEHFLTDYAESYVMYARANCPRLFPQELMLTELRLRFKQRVAHWTAEALKQVRDSEKRKRASEAPPSLKSWEDLEISFLSDDRVQVIRNGAPSETLNYAEMGFKDSRNGKPSQAWVTLRVLAEEKGTIRNPAKTRGNWSKVEKRVQEIRKALRKGFRISDNPVLFVRRTGYQARFKINCSPSFNT